MAYGAGQGKRSKDQGQCLRRIEVGGWSSTVGGSLRYRLEVGGNKREVGMRNVECGKKGRRAAHGGRVKLFIGKIGLFVN